jgi:hypothetical protein
VEDVFPAACTVVLEALAQVFDQEEERRVQQRSPAARFASPHPSSGPLMEALKHWLAQQCADRTVEPNSSGGKALQYLRTQWQPLTRFLQGERAPLENNIVEVRFVDQKPAWHKVWGIGPERKSSDARELENLIPVSVGFRPPLVRG